MQETVNTNQDKIKKICDALRSEALEPAKLEAEKIIAEARNLAETIVLEAKQKSEQLITLAKKKSEQEREVFQASLSQAFSQCLETLKQTIEQKLFNDILTAELIAEMSKPKVIADLIYALIKAIEKEGLSQNISLTIPKTISTDEVNHYLHSKVIDKLKKAPLELGQFVGGAQVRLIDQNITLEITEQTISEVLRRFLRKDFRSLLFRS